jgi:pyruvyltransferase
MIATTLERAGRKAKRVARRTAESLRTALDPDVPILTYYTYEANWGDALNPVLVRHISGRTPVHVDSLLRVPADRPVFSVIGSILGASPHPATEVWGSGFIGADRTFTVPPRRIHAVRGPLSRQLALRQGVACPEVYGDPALLYPRYYCPAVTPTSEVGLVPHSLDRESPWVRRLQETGSVRVVDVLSGVEAFVAALCTCRFIASSSLHGCIAADAYGVPFTWIELSDRVLGSGFKFRDYFASTGRDRTEPVRVNASTTIGELLDAAIEPGPDVDLDRLLAACPFWPPA